MQRSECATKHTTKRPR